jgi:protoporphyrinogen oxidase
MERVLVISGTPAGLRAAAHLASRGAEVRVLGVSEPVTGVPVDPPLGLGAVGIREGGDLDLGRLWGAAALVEGRRGVWLEGRLYDLPLDRADLARALGSEAPRAMLGIVKARARRRLGNVFDLGNEERSYEQWMRNRVGSRLWDRLFGPYARKRFGADPGELVAWLAWSTHCRPPAERFLAPLSGAEGAKKHQLDAIAKAGGEILEGARVEAFEVSGGRVVAVMAETGREHVDRLVLTDAPPHEVGAWLPADVLDDAWRFDLSRLSAAHAVQVTVPAAADHLPWDLHVVDADRPFWRLTRPGVLPGESRWAGWVTAHLTLTADDPLWRGTDAQLADAVRQSLSGIAEAGGSDAIVQRLPEAVPLHRLTTAMSLARRLDALDDLGVVGIGARGAFRHVDEGGELAFLEALAAQDDRDRGAARRPGEKRVIYQREVHRALFERPVRLPDRATPWTFVAS